MKKLTKEEQSDLKDLKKRPGYKVLLKVIEGMELDVFRMFKNVDTTNPNNLEILRRNTYYLKGMEDIRNTLDTGANQVSERKSDEQVQTEKEEKEKKEQE